jgi:hypothetical protein
MRTQSMDSGKAPGCGTLLAEMLGLLLVYMALFLLSPDALPAGTVSLVLIVPFLIVSELVGRDRAPGSVGKAKIPAVIVLGGMMGQWATQNALHTGHGNPWSSAARGVWILVVGVACIAYLVRHKELAASPAVTVFPIGIALTALADKLFGKPFWLAMVREPLGTAALFAGATGLGLLSDLARRSWSRIT